MMDALTFYVRLLLIHFANGSLVLAYTAWEQGPALLTGGGFVLLLRGAPSAQRIGVLAGGSVALLAAFLAPPPAPVLLAAMTLAGVCAVAVERFQPDGLRWRVVGGLALYAGAALAYLAYSAYLSGVDAAAWAEAIGGQEQAQATLAQGRAFLNTLATWGLWLILPLGFLSLLAQGLLAHPPVGERPERTIARVRTREHDETRIR